MSLTRRRKWVERAFFGVLLLLGLLLHADYGVSTDEPAHHLNGLVSAKYAAGLIAPAWTHRATRFARVPALVTHPDRNHGVLFELPVSLLGWLLAPADSAAYYPSLSPDNY